MMTGRIWSSSSTISSRRISFLPLQPRDHQLVGAGNRFQGVDGGVQVVVLLAQRCDPALDGLGSGGGGRLVVVHRRINGLSEGEPARRPRGAGRHYTKIGVMPKASWPRCRARRAAPPARTPAPPRPRPAARLERAPQAPAPGPQALRAAGARPAAPPP